MKLQFIWRCLGKVWKDVARSAGITLEVPPKNHSTSQANCLSAAGPMPSRKPLAQTLFLRRKTQLAYRQPRHHHREKSLTADTTIAEKTPSQTLSSLKKAQLAYRQPRHHHRKKTIVDTTIAETPITGTVIDRMVKTSYRFEMKGESRRK